VLASGCSPQCPPNRCPKIPVLKGSFTGRPNSEGQARAVGKCMPMPEAAATSDDDGRTVHTRTARHIFYTGLEANLNGDRANPHRINVKLNFHLN